MKINKGHREGLNQTYVAKKLAQSHHKWVIQKDAKDPRIPTEVSRWKRWPANNVNHSEVQLRCLLETERGIHGLKNPTRKWNTLQGKTKVQLWHLPNQRAIHDGSSQSASVQEFSVHSSSLSTIWKSSLVRNSAN